MDGVPLLLIDEACHHNISVVSSCYSGLSLTWATGTLATIAKIFVRFERPSCVSRQLARYKPQPHRRPKRRRLGFVSVSIRFRSVREHKYQGFDERERVTSHLPLLKCKPSDVASGLGHRGTATFATGPLQPRELVFCLTTISLISGRIDASTSPEAVAYPVRLGRHHVADQMSSG